MIIHPLFVHFPIAFLVVYALMEMVSPFIKAPTWWGSTKMFLVIAGWLSIIPTLITGDMAIDVIGEFPLSETHEHVAMITTTIFFLLFAAYIIKLFEQTGWGDKIARWNKLFTWSWGIKRYVARLLLHPTVAAGIALLGLVAITITGGLGAALVHGPNIDPVVTFIYGLFF